MVAVDAEVTPVHEPVRQPLDSGKGVVQAHIARDHRLHRVDLVELLGGDRLLHGLLEEQANRPQDSPHEQPGDRRPVHDGPHDARRGDDRRAEADALVAQDQEALALLELPPDDEREIEQQAGEYEVAEAVEEQPRKSLHVEPGRST